MLDLPKARVYGSSATGPSIVGRLGIAGKFFTMDGQPFTAIESSDFSLYKRFLDGDPIVPAILRQRRSLGFNMLRVWLLNASVVGFRDQDWRTQHGPADDGIHPRQYPDFYAKLAPFAALCGTFELCVEFTVFTQTPVLMPSKGDQQRHLDGTADALRGACNVLLELVNENDHGNDNTVSPDLQRPAGVLISRGSNSADAAPPRHDAPWDYELYHTNGLDQFQRKVGHNAMELAEESGRPCASNENTRYPDQDASADHAYDAGQNGALLAAGSCYHSQAGKLSTLFDGVELACAKAWADGAASVPLEFQHGQYVHLPELEGPTCIRAHARRLPDGREFISKVRP